MFTSVRNIVIWNSHKSTQSILFWILNRFVTNTDIVIDVSCVSSRISCASKAEIEFCSEFNRYFYFSSDNRTPPRLSDAYNTVFHRRYFVIMHVLLPVVQSDNGQIQTDFSTCHGISVTHELHKAFDVSCDIIRLLSL